VPVNGRRRRALFLGAVAAGLALGTAACVVNPVTGQRELALVTAADEVAIGDAQYEPSRQMQGGDFVVDPALTEYVRTVGERLAASSDRALPYEFVVLNSSVPNAWALPGGKIAVNRGLLTELGSEAELAAVLGHEIVHAAARHGALAMQRGLLLQTAVAVTAAATGRGDYSSWAVGAAGLGAQLINQRNSRDAELEADEYGMRYMSRAGYDPQAAVSLQETFVRLAEGRGNQGWAAGLFASHPPSAERVARNRATAATLPTGGELGRERYAAATASLRRMEPAYERYDEARRLLADGNADAAETAARAAIAQLPQEGHFYALLGDIEAGRGEFATAADHYNSAIARNEPYFYYHLRNGTAQRRLQQLDAAEASLRRSIELLPTAEGFYGLGAVAEQRGNRPEALEAYRYAAQSSGPAGVAAKDALLRLDLPVNPGQYLKLDTALDAENRLAIAIGNPTTQTVADVTVLIAYTDADGVGRQINRILPDVLEPGMTRRVATGIGPFPPAQNYAVAIVSTRVVTDAPP
jgi:predicted Zn-dependent protease